MARSPEKYGKGDIWVAVDYDLPITKEDHSVNGM